MKHTLIKAAVMAGVGGALLGGCQAPPKNLYQWGVYQPQVYQHFKGESPEQQIIVLEKNLQQISANGNLPPPGYHAHLGLLYSITGKSDLVVAQFEDEKKLFPESAVYMDFLLKKTKKGDK